MPTTRGSKKTLIAALTLIVIVGVAAQPAAARLSVAPAPIHTYAGDPGTLGDPASWRTPEFNRDVGLAMIGAEFAYAAGYSGAGESIGVVDSGVFQGHMREHGSLATDYAIGDRYFSVDVQAGNTPLTPGWYNQLFNDSHGTHVSGTVGASRDGVGETQPTGPIANMHGVAFNIDVHMGNTAKADGVLYGILPATATVAQTPDNAYIAEVYRAVNRAQTRDGRPIRLITSSWGSQPNTENYNTYDAPPGGTQTFGLNTAWRHWSLPDGIADVNGKTERWMNGALDVARTGTIIQFTAGNSGYVNPTPRGAAPYFLPELEANWFTTSGISTTGRTFNPDGSILVPGQQTFNQCGVAKWSCVTAPSNGINSTTVSVVGGVPQPRYGSASGTSMAGPHSAAALALIMQRFPYLTNAQTLQTMYTTGRQNNTISGPTGAAIVNPTRGQMVQVPDRRNGWHTPSLREAMKGPGQLLGPFDVDTQGYSDAWSNDISDVAIQARQQEDADEAAAWAATKVAKGWTEGLPDGASAADASDFAIGTRREAARNARIYEGSLTKRGEGTLFLVGNDTWHGTSTVAGGKLSVLGSHASSIDVRGGTLGGSGTIAGSVDVASGTLQPGYTAAEGAGVVDEAVASGNVLRAGGDVRIGSEGRLAVTIRSESDYTSVEAAGDVVLDDGELALDVQGPLRQGTVLTILSGRSISGSFHSLPEKRALLADGHLFRVSYRGNRMTLTVMHAVPPTAPPGEHGR